MILMNIVNVKKSLINEDTYRGSYNEDTMV